MTLKAQDTQVILPHLYGQPPILGITYGTILDQAKTASEPLSLYIHIPFCQKR